MNGEEAIVGRKKRGMTREQGRAVLWGLLAAGLLAVAIFVGSRNLRHIDAAPAFA